MLTAALLAELEGCLCRSGAPVDEMLAPGRAGDELARELEADGKERLSEELRTLWGWRNGGAGPEGPSHGAIGYWMWLLSSTRALQDENFWRELQQELEPTDAVWWYEGWVPFAKSGNTTLMADVREGPTSPSPVWQINTWDVIPPEEPLFASIEDFVLFCIGVHEAGAWYWSTEKNMYRLREECLTEAQRSILRLPRR